MHIANPIGKKGEDVAVEYLKQKGYQILERNFRRNYAEIDIIALFQETLIFVEVKTRTSETYGLPIESISPFKIRSLVKTAQLYTYLHPHLPESLRIDAVAIIFSTQHDVVNIEHIENICEYA